MADSDQIKVVIRVRPLIKRELQNCHDCRWKVKNEKSISQTDQSHLPAYIFDQIFDHEYTTQDLYSSIVAPIVESAMNGYHGTIFAYGQSGSGKTHTMSGSKHSPGIVSLAMQDIFDFIEQKPSHEFLMRASYMEIYNEKIFDLLSLEERNLKLHESVDHQISVNGLEEQLVNSYEQVFSVIQRAEAKRTIAETKQNDRSSRSHCIFRIIIESRLRDKADAAVMVSHLNFVDLAGSEKAGENSGDRFKEGCAINKSLFCLSQVISKLSDGESNQFIPYRDSKLTRILQNALGGNSKTAIICTVNPTATEETHSTLRFATRAKTIKNKPHVNEVLSEAAMLKKYRNEITRLQKMVTEMGVQDMQMANEDLRKQLEEKQELIKQLTQQIVVSSALPESVTSQKKKMRRETWCAPKLRRKSHFPSLTSFLDQRKITIQEETYLDLDHSPKDISTFGLEPLDIKPKHISFSFDNESRAKDFLRLSEGNEMLEIDSKLENDEDILMANTTLRDDSEKPLFGERFFLEEELHILQEQLNCAEKQNERMDQELVHLCDKRFNLDLRELQELMDNTEKLQEDLRIKNKKVQDLEKALAGQEPYIARLEAQLEMQMGASNGHLGSTTKRRSGIPVARKKDGQQSEDIQLTEKFDVVEAATSTEDLQQLQYLFQATTSVDLSPQQQIDMTSVQDPQQSKHIVEAMPSTEDLSPQQRVVQRSAEEFTLVQHMVDSMTSTEDLSPQQQLVTLSKGLQMSQMVEAMTSTEDLSLHQHNITTAISTLPQHMTDEVMTSTEDLFPQESMVTTPTKGISWAQNSNKQVILVDVGIMTEQDFNKAHCSSESTVFMGLKEDDAPACVSDTELSQKNVESDAKRDNSSEFVLEGSTELSKRLQEKEHEVEQLQKLNVQLSEILNQAYAENLRLKEAMEALEQADAERLEEINELPKLKALLARRDMEIQRLESQVDRLKDEMGQMSFNSSSLSSSFSEAPRRSVLLAEREEEVWQLKERLVGQAHQIEELQQEKVHLEDLIIDLRAQLDQRARGLPNIRTRMSGCANSPHTPFETSFDREVEQEVLDQSQRRMIEADMESLQRKIFEQGSQISRLETLLQEKDEDIEILFDRNMIIPKDIAEVRIQEMEEQQRQLEKMSATLDDKNQELMRIKASLELFKLQERSPSEMKESSFQENLILEKMSLEEALQEKSEQLKASLEEREELEVKLDERRNMINNLRQQLEELEEKLEESQVGMSSLSLRASEVMADAEISTVHLPEQEVNPISSSSNCYEELLQSLKAREQELLQSLEEKEAAIAELKKMLSSTTLLVSQEKEAEMVVQSEQNADEQLPSKELSDADLQSGKVSCDSELEIDIAVTQAALDIQLKLQELRAVMEEKQHLEEKLRQMSVVVNEKIALEAKVQELSYFVLEKADLDAKLQELNLAVKDKASLEIKVRELLALTEKDEHHLKTEMSPSNSLVEALDSQLDKLKVKLDRLSVAEETIASLEHREATLVAVEEEKARLEKRATDLETEMKSVQLNLEQSKIDSEELKAELTWQTQAAETLQGKLETLQEELTKQKQEADADVNRLTQEVEDALQELEKTNSLLESSEQCCRVTEETLEEYKQNFDRLETNLQKLAQERDEFELKLDAANKEQEKRNQKIDELQSRISVLERELQNALHRKDLLEGVLADKESAHRIGESLHEKLSKELQESQTEVLAMQAQLTQLSLELHRQEGSCTRLKTANSEMEAEILRLTQLEATLQKENSELKSLIELNNSKVTSLEEELQTMAEIKKEKDALHLQINKCHTEITSLQGEVANLQQESKSSMTTIQALQADNKAYKDAMDELAVKLQTLNAENAVALEIRAELVARIQTLEEEKKASWDTRAELNMRIERLQEENKSAIVSRDEFGARIQGLEEQSRQSEIRSYQLMESIDRLVKDKEKIAEEAHTLQVECERLEKENSEQLQQIERLQKEVAETKPLADASSNQSTSEKVVPALEFKQMKCLLRNQIKDLKMEIEQKKNVIKCQKEYISDLQNQLEQYENRENVDSKEKELEEMVNSLKRKDYEVAHQKMKHQKEVETLSQKLKNAEDTVAYKESCISKLKDEIRRMRSEDISFCTPANPAKETPPQASVKPEEVRVISSHSGIIDRYTVTLLEADKYRLQRELKKTQERLKKTEAELHWAKVSLSKFTTGNELGTSHNEKADSSKTATPDKRLGSCTSLSSSSASPCLKPSLKSDVRSPLVSVITPAADRLPLRVDRLERSAVGSESFILSENGLSSRNSDDNKKESRLPLQSISDKVNTALGKEDSSLQTPAEMQTAQAGESKENSLKIDPDVWKKPKRPHVLKSYTRPSTKLLSSKSGQGADQCKQQ